MDNNEKMPKHIHEHAIAGDNAWVAKDTEQAWEEYRNVVRSIATRIREFAGQEFDDEIILSWFESALKNNSE